MNYEPPLRASTEPKITRRSVLTSALAFGAFAVSAPAWAQTSTPTSLAEGDVDALEVLKSAGTQVLELDTFTFSMKTTAGSSTIFPGVDVDSIEGSVRRPLDVAATLNVKALMQTMSISAVVVDSEVYVQNPLSGGAWESMGRAPEIASMINPDWILLAGINLIQEAQITGDRDGSTLIEGYINLTDSAGDLDLEQLRELEQFIATGPVDVAFWINEDNYITRAELYGPIFASESPDVEKRIELGNFNEPVEIESPVV